MFFPLLNFTSISLFFSLVFESVYAIAQRQQWAQVFILWSHSFLLCIVHLITSHILHFSWQNYLTQHMLTFSCLKFFALCYEQYKRVGQGTTIRFLHLRLRVMGSKHGNSLSTWGDKAAYIWPLSDPAMMGVSYNGMPFLSYEQYHSNSGFFFF